MDCRRLLVIGPVLLLLACASPERELEKAKQTGTVEALDAFLERYPEHPLTATAKALREARAFQRATEAGTLAAYRGFLDQHPEGKFHELAQKALGAVGYPKLAPAQAYLASIPSGLPLHVQPMSAPPDLSEKTRVGLTPQVIPLEPGAHRVTLVAPEGMDPVLDVGDLDPIEKRKLPNGQVTVAYSITKEASAPLTKTILVLPRGTTLASAAQHYPATESFHEEGGILDFVGVPKDKHAAALSLLRRGGKVRIDLGDGVIVLEKAYGGGLRVKTLPDSDVKPAQRM